MSLATAPGPLAGSPGDEVNFSATTHCPVKVGGHLSFDREALTIETAGP